MSVLQSRDITMFLYITGICFENLYSILDKHLQWEKLSHLDFQYSVLKHASMSGCNSSFTPLFLMIMFLWHIFMLHLVHEWFDVHKKNPLVLPICEEGQKRWMTVFREYLKCLAFNISTGAFQYIAYFRSILYWWFHVRPQKWSIYTFIISWNYIHLKNWVFTQEHRCCRRLNSSYLLVCILPWIYSFKKIPLETLSIEILMLVLILSYGILKYRRFSIKV